MLTSGTLSGLQEFLASWIAHDRSKSGHYFTSRVPKMAIYGAFISAPLGHVLITALQKLFQGRKSLKAKVLQILASNLLVSGVIAVQFLFCFTFFGSSLTLIPRLRPFRTVSTSSPWPSLPAHAPSTKSALLSKPVSGPS